MENEEKDKKVEKEERDFLIAQWNRFASNEENLIADTGKIFTIVVAFFGIISVVGQADSFIASGTIHLGIIILFWYEAYKLRILHLLKGYLARIEEQLVEKEGESWYKNVERKYVSHYSAANRFIWIPVFLVSIIVEFACIREEFKGYSWDKMDKNIAMTLVIVLTVLSFVIPIISLMMNETFKKDVHKDPYVGENLRTFFKRKKQEKAKEKNIGTVKEEIMGELSEKTGLNGATETTSEKVKLRTNRKEKMTERGKTEFQFDIIKELTIYKIMSFEKVSKKNWKKIDETHRFCSHDDWKKYVREKYSSFKENELKEFDFYLSHLIETGKAVYESSNLIVSAIVSALVTMCFNFLEGTLSNPQSGGLNVGEVVVTIIIMFLGIMGVVYMLIRFFVSIMNNNRDSRCETIMLREYRDIIQDLLSEKTDTK